MITSLTKEQIKKLVRHFYQRVQQDELLGPIFNDIAQVDWAHHIPKICQFWNNIMLKTNEYHGNPYKMHVMLGSKVALTEAHFSRWLMLFQEEAYKHLLEQDADRIVKMATKIASSLKIGAISKNE